MRPHKYKRLQSGTGTDGQTKPRPAKEPCIYILNAEAVLLKIVVFGCLTCPIYIKLSLSTSYTCLSRTFAKHLLNVSFLKMIEGVNVCTKKDSIS